MRILYQIALITESLIGFLEVNTADALPHCVPIFPQVFDECSIYDQLLTCYFKIHDADDVQ